MHKIDILYVQLRLIEIEIMLEIGVFTHPGQETYLVWERRFLTVALDAELANRNL